MSNKFIGFYTSVLEDAIPENLPIVQDGPGVKVRPEKMIMGRAYTCEVAGVNVVAVRTGPDKVKFYEGWSSCFGEEARS